jgi:hypothetical protein
MPARRGPSPLLRELIRANQRARDDELQECLTACGLASVPLYWGIDFIRISGLSSELAPDGEGDGAAIVPVFEHPYGGLIDLVAHRVRDARIATRRGNASVLGERWVECARQSGIELPVYSHPLRWMANRCCGAVIVDWTQTGFILDGVAAVACDSLSLARRIHDTTRRMSRPPRLLFAQQRSV